ncbi:hypothetical protein JOM56_010897 [Amanita muscaria]
MDSPTVSTQSASTVRRRLREDDSPSKRLKRAKAAERQRRKRERDRTSAANSLATSMLSYSTTSPSDHVPSQAVQQSISAPMTQAPGAQGSAAAPASFTGHEMTPEEMARRERVRAAARERQRKHRQLVKERKMRALGLEMGNEMMPGMPPPDGAPFHHVLPPELQGHPPPPPMGHEPPTFPQGQLSGGRLFASTILLSFSCDPLLKQHLMRTLHMTHDELASLEPVIADAWEHWDHQRRLHYEKQGTGVPGDGGPGVPAGAPNGPHPYSPPPPANGDPSQNEFRARFRSSIEVPPPFAYQPNAPVDPAIQSPTTATAAAGTSSGASADSSIDPKLAAQPRPGAEGATGNGNDAANKAAVSGSIDPSLAQDKET